MCRHILDEVDLFFIRLRKGWVSEDKKKKLYQLVINLEGSTQCQKERFILLYSLKPEQKEKYNFSSLGKEQGCTAPAIKYSISRIRSELVNLQDERKNIFLDIIKNNDYFQKENEI